MKKILFISMFILMSINCATTLLRDNVSHNRVFISGDGNTVGLWNIDNNDLSVLTIYKRVALTYQKLEIKDIRIYYNCNDNRYGPLLNY